MLGHFMIGQIQFISLVIGTAVFPLYYSNITEGATVSFLGTEWEHPDTLYSYALSFFFFGGCFYVTYFISHCRLYWKQKAFSSNFLLDRLVICNVFILF